MRSPADGTGQTAALAATESAPEVGPVAVLVHTPEELAATAGLPVGSSSVPEGSVHVSGEVPRASGGKRFVDGGRIGSGGMGEVVLQHDTNIGRAVAKKMLHPHMHNVVSLQRFVREARVQGQLEHPAVVPVHDFGVDEDGRLFFSMKRIRGKTLAELTDQLALHDKETEARFSRHKLLSAFVQVCLAIEYAHKRGVIHRDLKPSNIMLGDFGEVYVLDWGLAKLTARAADAPPEVELRASERQRDPRHSAPDMTSDGDLLGTPLYMAPEQMLGRHAEADERADVFSLGAILFELLAREPYRRGTTLAALLDDADSTARVERPSERNPDAPTELDDLCLAALARDPSVRLPSARALADAVERYLEGDRDLALRRAQAAELIASARARRYASSRTTSTEIVVAMREVLKALALRPGDREAERLLVSLMLEGSSELSPEAERVFAERDVDLRVIGLRRGVGGFLSWLATLPLAFVVGIRSGLAVGLLVALALLGIAAALLFLRAHAAGRAAGRSPAAILGGVCAVVVIVTSAWLGPFVLTPLVGCAVAIMFLVHLRREEGPLVLGLFMVSVLVPFVAEWLHLVPPAYTFRDGGILLHARMLDLPEVPTVLFLAYTSVAFIGLLGYFVMQLRGKQRTAERRLFGQAWLLERLFPAADGEDA